MPSYYMHDYMSLHAAFLDYMLNYMILNSYYMIFCLQLHVFAIYYMLHHVTSLVATAAEAPRAKRRDTHARD